MIAPHSRSGSIASFGPRGDQGQDEKWTARTAALLPADGDALLQTG